MQMQLKLILLLFTGWIATFAVTAATSADGLKQSEKRATEARLGIGVSPLPDVLKSHLPKVIEDGRGVIVSEVTEGSAADKAGLKQHDVLVRYGDQDLYAPEQLVKRVRNDDPGKEVEIQYVRAGELQTAKVTLGKQAHRKLIVSDWPILIDGFNIPWSPLRPEFWTEAKDAECDSTVGMEWPELE